jgi:hypothetical protein
VSRLLVFASMLITVFLIPPILIGTAMTVGQYRDPWSSADMIVAYVLTATMIAASAAGWRFLKRGRETAATIAALVPVFVLVFLLLRTAR